MEPKSVITVKDLTKRYKGSDEEALKGINLTVHAGEFFGLLGPNSAGKTTFTSIMCGLIRPTSGSVDIFNTDITHSYRSLKKYIGLVPQEIALYDTLYSRGKHHVFRTSDRYLWSNIKKQER